MMTPAEQQHAMPFDRDEWHLFMAAFGDRKPSPRPEHARSAREWMAEMGTYLDRVCRCGHKRGDHDVAGDFNQPCTEDGCECLDFTERGTNGNTTD